MDPITSLGVASSAIQIIDFGVRFLSQVKELSDSAKLDLDEFAPLRQEATQLRSLNGILIDAVRRRKELHESNPIEKEILSICAQSNDVARDLIEKLDHVSKSKKPGKADALGTVLRAMMGRKDIKKHHARLLKFRDSLVTTILINTQ